MATKSVEKVVGSLDRLMGVKAVFGRLTSQVLCFGGRGVDPTRSAYYSVAAGAAGKVGDRPFVVTIGGGKRVPEELNGRVLNVARVGFVYGPTKTLVTDPDEAARLSQWPVAITIHEAWKVLDEPHLVEDLEMPDKMVLAGAQDGIIRPSQVNDLWKRLRGRPIEPVPLLWGANFHDPGRPTFAYAILPMVPGGASGTEGTTKWRLQKSIERDRTLAQEAKRLNAAKYGLPTCEACRLSSRIPRLFDVHHPSPLSAGQRMTLAEQLEVLCPTCHRKAHLTEDKLIPLTLAELRDWIAAGRP